MMLEGVRYLAMPHLMITKGHSISLILGLRSRKLSGNFPSPPLIFPLIKGGLREVSEYLPAGRQVGKIKPLIYYLLSDTQDEFIN